LRLGDLPTSSAFDLTSTLAANNASFTVDVGSSFFEQNGNDQWTIFFADQSPGGQDSLLSWQLNITTVPEPVNLALGLFGALGVGVVAFRRLRSSRIAA
jgi:hypothetical protein